MSRFAGCCRSSGRRRNGGIGPSACLWVLARLAAPYYERRSLKDRKPLFFTPYSISVLASNGCFSPCGCIEVLCISAAPAGADPAGYGRMAHCTEGSGQGTASSHPAPHDQRRPLLSCSVFRPSAAHPGYFSGCAAFYRSACPLAFLPRFVYTEIVLYFLFGMEGTARHGCASV